MADRSSGGALSGGRAEPSSEHRFGWRNGLALGLAVLVAVYAIAALTAALPPLRDAVEHLPIAIAVLVAGTIGVLVVILARPRRS